MLKPLSIILAILALIVLLVVVEFIGPSGKPTVFAEVDFDKAQTDASKAKPAKMLVVVFTGDNCEACKEMDRRVWSTGSMTDWLNRHAVAVKIDRDKDPGRARSLGVQSVPAVVLLDGKKVLTKLEGQHTARDLIEKFDAALAARSSMPATPTSAEPAKPVEPEKKDKPDEPKPGGGPGGASEPEGTPATPR